MSLFDPPAGDGAPPTAEEALRAADRRARRAVLAEFERPLVLQAGAGTGKTAALVARVLAWVLGEGWQRAATRREDVGRGRPGAGDAGPEALAAAVLERVVAITFTEAAAAEMAARVAAALAELEAGRSPVGFDPALLGEVPVAERARHLLAHLDRLQVSTIHAFCRRLLAAHPVEAGLHPAFAVDAEALEVDETVREVVEQRLREAYAEPGDPAALELAACGVGPADLAAATRLLLLDGVPVAALAADTATPARLGELAAAVAAASDRLTAAAAPLGRSRTLAASRDLIAAVAAVAEAARRLAAEPSPSALGRLTAAAGGVLEPAKDRRLSNWRRESFIKAEQACLDEAAARELAAAAEGLSPLLKHLARLDLDRLTAARRALIPIVRDAAERLRRRGVITFQGLLAGARELLAGHPGVRAEERRKIDQLLVDEFQDTDRLQCEVVRLLALDGPPEERPGLFLVGDPKQSVYGWRDADLAAYDAFVAEVVAAGGAVETLAVSFRSVPPVLAEVERLVAPVMERSEGLQPAFEPLVASRESERGFTAGDRRPVERWASLAPPASGTAAATSKSAASELEAAAVARDLRQLHDDHGVAFGAAAILVRATTDLEVYLAALKEAGVPYAVERDRSYYRRREVIDAKMLACCVLDPADHLALVTCLRAPWVGVPDAALPGLWRHDLPRRMTELERPDPEALAELRAIAERVASRLPVAAVPGLDRLAGWEESLVELCGAIAELRAAFTAEPADRFVERLRRRTLIEATEAARYLGAWRLANLDRFFRDLAAMLDAGSDAEAALRFLRRAVGEEREAQEARPRQAGEDAVQVMTVHAAKGLDFGHVYLVQLHKETAPPGAPPVRAQLLSVDGQERWELELFGWPSPGAWRAEHRRREVEAAEQVRLLYVAATRAADRLVLAGLPGRRRNGWRDARCLADLVALGADEPAAAARMEELAAAGRWWEEDAHGVRRAYPGLAAANAEPPRPAGVRQLPSPEAVATASAALARRRSAAAAYRARPFRGAVSEAAHHALEELLLARAAAGGGEVAERPAVGGREVATAVGTAVHRLLEEYDFAADPAAELERQRRSLDEFLVRALPPVELEPARRRTAALLERLVAGPLWRRFLALAPHIVARELPVLLLPAPGNGQGSEAGPAGDGPVGVVVGTADLVYRDPAGGELVIADYKTDELADRAELEARGKIYRLQGEPYRRALREALELPALPRFELWFLSPGEVWPPPETAQLSLF